MIRLHRASKLLTALVLIATLAAPHALARLFKGATIQSKDSTILLEKSKLNLRTDGPVLVEESRDKTGTSVSVRPEGGFGYLIRVDRLTIGRHILAPATAAVDIEYLRDVLTKLRAVTYSQRGIKLLGTVKEEPVTIDQTQALLAVDKMSIDANGNYIPEHYRGFLLFERQGSIVIAHYESTGVWREVPTNIYVAQLTAILRALTIQTHG